MKRTVTLTDMPAATRPPPQKGTQPWTGKNLLWRKKTESPHYRRDIMKHDRRLILTPTVVSELDLSGSTLKAISCSTDGGWVAVVKSTAVLQSVRTARRASKALHVKAWISRERKFRLHSFHDNAIGFALIRAHDGLLTHFKLGLAEEGAWL